MEKFKLTGDVMTGEVWLNDNPITPKKSQKIVNHSPDGFSWGYGGSGPAQLSLAILLEVLPEDEAKDRYQDFKWAITAQLPQTDFSIEVKFDKESFVKL